MIAYTPRAARQIEKLRQYYEERERLTSIVAFDRALALAERKIEDNPMVGLAAPRPYPRLARHGRAWIKAGRYWIAYAMTQPPVIIAVFFETADIPSRID